MASISDYFGKASADNHYGEVTTVKTNRLPAESVLAAFDLSTLPDDVPVFFLTYKKQVNPDTDEVEVTNQTGWKALVDKDANTLTDLTLAPGYTDIGNEAGDYIEAVPTSFWGNSLVEGVLTHSNPDGSLNPEAVDIAIGAGDRWKEALSDFIADGTGVLAQTTLLTGSFSDIVYYISGSRYTKTGIANKLYVASKDTYVFINTAGAVTYTDVANNAVAPATPPNSILVGKVVTNATTITSVTLLSRGAVTADKIDFTTFRMPIDANGWSRSVTAAGKSVWMKRGTSGLITLPNGISFANGNLTTMPVGLVGTDLMNGTHVLTQALITDSSTRHIMPHTMFNNGSGTMISYGIINTYTGGGYSGYINYSFRIEQV